MKLYEFTTTEHNGEQEYSHYHLVYAETEIEALTKAREYCKQWYQDEDVAEGYNDDPDCWAFWGGSIILSLDSIKECEQKVWKESRFMACLIGELPQEQEPTGC